MFNQATLSLGGNKGNRYQLLAMGMQELKEAGEVLFKSSIYETASWGGIAKGNFLNQVVQIQTALTPQELLLLIQKIESKLGRTRDEHWGDRTMDIDILYFGEMVITNENLQVPHPFIPQRKFVLVPLVEILPNFIHPVLGLSHMQMLQDCEDHSEVVLYKNV